jgi:hypothetical protein
MIPNEKIDSKRTLLFEKLLVFISSEESRKIVKSWYENNKVTDSKGNPIDGLELTPVSNVTNIKRKIFTQF